MRDRHGIAVQDQSAVAWPPDDTEESVLGTNLHQATITNLRLGLNEIAAASAPGQPAPWQALSQTILTGLWRRDGSRYQVLPDVFVYRRPIDERRASVSLATDGPPALIIEIASDVTYEADLDLEFGKGYSYAAAGVLEYLALDPTGEFIPERGRGWRQRDGVSCPGCRITPGAGRAAQSRSRSRLKAREWRCTTRKASGSCARVRSPLSCGGVRARMPPSGPNVSRPTPRSWRGARGHLPRSRAGATRRMPRSWRAGKRILLSSSAVWMS